MYQKDFAMNNIHPRPDTQPASLSLKEAQDYYKALLRPVFAGRKFLLAGGVAVNLGNQARRLAGLGAARPFLLADSEGTGRIPTPAEAELHVLNIRGVDILDQHHQSENALRHLTPDVQAAVEAWDPEGEARWLCGIMLSEIATIAGRRKYASREPSWTQIEDKIAIDEFWDNIGVIRAPSRIVPVERAALTSAVTALDRGMGTVWAADTRKGINGGGIGLRWVRAGDDGSAAIGFFRNFAHRVRVMPFLEGIPVSIHGVVFPDFVAVFRPVEMVVLRQSTGDRLLYTGCSNWFDPRQEDRETMRRIAQRVGAALRETVGYRGAFTVDGVLAEEGFLPTELNPRIGGGMGTLTKGLGDFPLIPLCWAVTEGEPLDYRPSLFERIVLASADTYRAGGGWATTSTQFNENAGFNLVHENGEYREAPSNQKTHAVLTYGPGPLGGFLGFGLDADLNQTGTPVAPEVVRALRFADRRLGTNFGHLEAAKNVRP